MLPFSHWMQKDEQQGNGISTSTCTSINVKIDEFDGWVLICIFERACVRECSLFFIRQLMYLLLSQQTITQWFYGCKFSHSVPLIDIRIPILNNNKKSIRSTTIWPSTQSLGCRCKIYICHACPPIPCCLKAKKKNSPPTSKYHGTPQVCYSNTQYFQRRQ